ncbi:ATP-grasp domain-containing protein [Pontibacillus marinus]|uniref:RimK family alpha-L-glutamate ligase n=1 Tax=Pontibacillus marinus BH030004 = DSM 16465 TaxID=1385511 RepID=A0A0A5G7R0_9BACI|nr:RimK family alpha-L-glutamate ligase [Pontibacillus marinus]KGX88054.1 RimK family alpha-L-glutamate ligase [Pontibacillus marinus BH030004 = DSM 16465]
MLTGWIVYNGHLPGDKFLDYAKWIRDAASRKEMEMDVYPNHHLLSLLGTGKSDIVEKDILPDFVVFGDKDILLARQFEQMGVPVFNSSFAIEACDHKGLMYQLLAQHSIPIPKTILGPKIFPGTKEIDAESFQNVCEQIGFPLIIKEAYGSFGEQVYLINSQEEMFDKLKEIQGKPFLFQEFISSSYGRDVRLNVVGNQVVTSMLRYADDDFRANVSAGGHMKPYEPSKQEKDLAIKASQAIGADFAGVDLLFGPNDEPIVCEINGNAHIRNIYNCTGVNVADDMINYIIEWFARKEDK